MESQPYDDRHDTPLRGDLAPARAFLSRDAILDAPDLEVRDVEVPEWGGYVRVQGLTGAQRARINATTVAAKGQSVELRVEALTDLQLRMVGMALVDLQGQRLFDDNAIMALGRKNAGVIERLYNIVAEMSGLVPGASSEAARGN